MATCKSVAIRFNQWDTVNLAFRIINEDGSEKDITWYTVRFIAKKKAKDLDAAAVIDITSAIHTDAIHGRTTISLTSVQSAAIASWNYLWQLRTISTTAVVTTVIIGQLQVLDTLFDD